MAKFEWSVETKARQDARAAAWALQDAQEAERWAEWLEFERNWKAKQCQN